MSQIGYMMLALGVSKYGGEEGLGFMASMFHLFTHAMFKALLFLGAGAIIHAVHSNDMIDMGSLRKYMPITHITFLIACLAIAGIPPLSGFFSKDEILVAAYNHNVLYFWVEWIVAGLTAFYMFRLYFSVFWGKEQNYEQAPHEAPPTMTIPLVLLAIGAAGAGLIPFSQFVTSDGVGFDIHMHMHIALPSIGIALAGIIVAYVMYKKETELPTKLSTGFKGLYTAAYKKFYVDEVYLYVTKNIIFNVFASSIAWVDRYIVDGVMNLTASLTNILSFSIRGLQSGQLQQYAFVFVSSVLVMVLAIIYMLSI
jgi:NADH-quinone oxidoreductase subunit L